MMKASQQLFPRISQQLSGLGWLRSLGLLLLAVPWLLFAAGGFLIVRDPLQRADAVVPLAGELVRPGAAAQLFNDGYVDWFVATTMREGLEHGIPEERILIAPPGAHTTYQEAVNIRTLAQAEGWRSLIVVTSPSHTRRARMIVRGVFRGTGITITVRPVEPHWYTATSWWRTAEGRNETLKEYLKFVAHFIGYDRTYRHPK